MPILVYGHRNIVLRSPFYVEEFPNVTQSQHIQISGEVLMETQGNHENTWIHESRLSFRSLFLTKFSTPVRVRNLGEFVLYVSILYKSLL